ncbi:MAG: threonine--tRNA ligase, partial [Nanoarchaeota archaeon]
MVEMIKLTLPDGSVQEHPIGVTGLAIAEKISVKLAEAALAVKVNDRLLDVKRPIRDSGDFHLITVKDSKEALEIIRHSTAHLMAQAIKRLFPKANPTIGPVIEDGFYYDFDNLQISSEDLPRIEDEMRRIAAEGLSVKREEWDKKKARAFFKDEKYKLELIKDIDESTVSIYTQGDFTDLCRGPHLPKVGMVGTFKLMKLAGAYWRGDARNAQLTRIYGTAWLSEKDLKDYLERLEEAEKRDHRLLGKQLELFSFHEESPGTPFFHPKGAIIYNELLRFMREEYVKRGYHEVITPLLYDKSLWETSGHWAHFRDDMFVMAVDGKEASLKPMNCPSHCLMYRTRVRSYRELPLRLADFAPLHRNELKGVLSGLTRVRKFSQDDAHIFCAPEQMQSEIESLLQFVEYVFKGVFDFEYELKLSTKPESAMGEQDLWDKAEAALTEALQKTGKPFEVAHGDGAFYGPKVDFVIRDALGRGWQLATVQVDFQMPLRFGLE